MAKTRQQKEDLLSSYEGFLKNAKAVYLASTKLSANDASNLKKDLIAKDARYYVLKNTIFALAAKKILGENLNLGNQTAAIFCSDEVVEPAKVLSTLKKENKAEYILCILDGKVIDVSKIESLANLESKEQLLGKLMYLVNYPTTGLARALNNNITKLLYALNAVKDKE